MRSAADCHRGERYGQVEACVHPCHVTPEVRPALLLASIIAADVLDDGSDVCGAATGQFIARLPYPSTVSGFNIHTEHEPMCRRYTLLSPVGARRCVMSASLG
ncbi:hypothetical protein PI126_g20771 [Phytophthora idaei]|nr:hypothetical protein PI126_g20771 [Phytophthora idaei]